MPAMWFIGGGRAGVAEANGLLGGTVVITNGFAFSVHTRVRNIDDVLCRFLILITCTTLSLQHLPPLTSWRGDKVVQVDQAAVSTEKVGRILGLVLRSSRSHRLQRVTAISITFINK